MPLVVYLPPALFLLPTSQEHVSGSRLTCLALPDLEHWKQTVLLHLTTLCACVCHEPPGLTPPSCHPADYFPSLVSATPAAFLPGNFFQSLHAAKQTHCPGPALNFLNKHTVGWQRSHSTSFPSVITALLCSLIFWICSGEVCASQSRKALSLVGPLVPAGSLRVPGNYPGPGCEKTLCQVNLEHSICSDALGERYAKLHNQAVAVKLFSATDNARIAFCASPRLPKALGSQEWELRVCAGIHFERVIWRTAWEPESLWVCCVFFSLGLSFLGSRKCLCIRAHGSRSRCSGAINQRVVTATRYSLRTDVCHNLHLIQHDEHRRSVQLTKR